MRTVKSWLASGWRHLPDVAAEAVAAVAPHEVLHLVRRPERPQLPRHKRAQPEQVALPRRERKLAPQGGDHRS